ncbi:hypothetical protein [Acidocella sp.]|uniref:hypothetical protein n=1 Tax=Acidocella sp. TaxID=50710 RepID=UPI00263905FD|nr:hypothetical protein [Acidocella sp.]MDD2794394.1 hypothetical protein [Acidocella sp.]
MNDEQKKLARHALGLRNGQKTSCRNHFVAGVGHTDWSNLMEMVKSGDAIMRKGSVLSGDDPVFFITAQGAKAAILPGEKLCAKDFPNA